MLLLKNVLFTIFIPGTVVVLLPLLITHGAAITQSFGLLILGLAIILTGIFIYAWTVWDFATIGKGTPLPIDAPKKLVVRGLYRFTRNPMYVGVLLVILGWACLFADAWLVLYAGFVWLIINLFVVAYEEPKLRALFGNEYTSYQARVRRWIPRIH